MSDDFSSQSLTQALRSMLSMDSPPVELTAPIPVLRIFSRAKAAEFYLDYLGFALDWPDQPLREDASTGPLYTQISRGAAVLQLSEHHGDGSPGAVSFIRVTGLDSLHRELSSRAYANLNPGIESIGPRLRVLEVIDPFSNRLRFGEITMPPSTESAS